MDLTFDPETWRKYPAEGRSSRLHWNRQTVALLLPEIEFTSGKTVGHEITFFDETVLREDGLDFIRTEKELILVLFQPAVIRSVSDLLCEPISFCLSRQGIAAYLWRQQSTKSLKHVTSKKRNRRQGL